MTGETFGKYWFKSVPESWKSPKVLNLFRNRLKSVLILQVLNLSRNALPELRLPPSLSSLVALDLSHNKISRIDPVQLGDLPELQVNNFISFHPTSSQVWQGLHRSSCGCSRSFLKQNLSPGFVANLSSLHRHWSSYSTSSSSSRSFLTLVF